MTNNSVWICWEELRHGWWCWWVSEFRLQFRCAWSAVSAVYLRDTARCCWGHRWSVAVGRFVAWGKQQSSFLVRPRLAFWNLLLLYPVLLLLLNGFQRCRCPCCYHGSRGGGWPLLECTVCHCACTLRPAAAAGCRLLLLLLWVLSRTFLLGLLWCYAGSALGILPGWFWRKGWIHPLLSNHPGSNHYLIQIVQCKTASAARNWINSFPPRISLFFCLYPFSMIAVHRNNKIRDY